MDDQIGEFISKCETYNAGGWKFASRTVTAFRIEFQVPEGTTFDDLRYITFIPMTIYHKDRQYTGYIQDVHVAMEIHSLLSQYQLQKALEVLKRTGTSKVGYDARSRTISSVRFSDLLHEDHETVVRLMELAKFEAGELIDETVDDLLKDIKIALVKHLKESRDGL